MPVGSSLTAPPAGARKPVNQDHEAVVARRPADRLSVSPSAASYGSIECIAPARIKRLGTALSVLAGRLRALCEPYPVR